MPLIDTGYADYECPACAVRQAVYLGSLDDPDHPEVERVRCYACGNVEVLDPEYAAMMDPGSLFEATGEPIRGA